MKDIDEVLQVHTVFANVSKGQVAKKEDLQKAFGDMTQTDICKLILQKGELQVSDKERQSALDEQLRSVIYSISKSCINPQTRRPYPVSIIEQSLKDAHFSLKPNRNVKQQTMDAIKVLKEYIPLERSRMKLRVCVSIKEKDTIDTIKKIANEIKSTQQNTPKEGLLEFILLIEPAGVKELESLIHSSKSSKDNILEILEVREVPTSTEIY